LHSTSRHGDEFDSLCLYPSIKAFSIEEERGPINYVDPEWIVSYLHEFEGRRFQDSRRRIINELKVRLQHSLHDKPSVMTAIALYESGVLPNIEEATIIIQNGVVVPSESVNLASGDPYWVYSTIIMNKLSDLCVRATQPSSFISLFLFGGNPLLIATTSKFQGHEVKEKYSVEARSGNL
jgi:hypothetical protein